MCAGTEDHSVSRAIKCRVGVGVQDVETSRGRLRRLDFLCSWRGAGVVQAGLRAEQETTRVGLRRTPAVMSVERSLKARRLEVGLWPRVSSLCPHSLRPLCYFHEKGLQSVFSPKSLHPSLPQAAGAPFDYALVSQKVLGTSGL